MAAERSFVFTITPGHTGTTWLSELLAFNLPGSRVYHEILGYDRFGVDTPDISHMTLFNSQGNVAQVRAFWEQKAARILADDTSWYGETSHLLSKCGLLENIGLFTRVGTVYIICLDRDLLALVRSMRRRCDMLNKGDQWLWHLDPDYPRKLLSAEFFAPYGVDGTRLWYGCEMRTRAAYYRQLLAREERIRFIKTSIEALAEPRALVWLFGQLGLRVEPENIAVPPRANVSAGQAAAGDEPVARLIGEMQFDPEAIAAQYIARGYRLGVDVGAQSARQPV